MRPIPIRRMAIQSDHPLVRLTLAHTVLHKVEQALLYRPHRSVVGLS
jgi:hypothetical protein